MENISVGDTVFVSLPFFQITGYYPVVRIEEDGGITINVKNEINLSVIPSCYALIEKTGKPDDGQLNLSFSEG